jgi:ribose transport system permease protein
MPSNNPIGKTISIDWSKYIVYIGLVIMIIFFGFWLRDEGFMTVPNVMNIFRQTAMISVMAVAMTFVIGAAQIDLSVGAITAFVAMLSALTLNATDSILLAIAVGLAIGVGIGAMNGYLITKFGIPSFLTTLGMMNVVRGSAMWVTDTAPVPIGNTTFTTIFGTGYVGGVPVLLLWTIVFIVIGVILLNYTPFGKRVLAVGGNEIAATYTGINADRVKMSVFIMSGAFAAFAGIMYMARLQTARYTYGDGDELTVIAAVILGGTAMEGGKGSIIGALAGSILMGTINNGLILGGLSVSQQIVVKGLIIILAVLSSNISRRKRKVAT